MKRIAVALLIYSIGQAMEQSQLELYAENISVEKYHEKDIDGDDADQQAGTFKWELLPEELQELIISYAVANKADIIEALKPFRDPVCSMWLLLIK